MSTEPKRRKAYKILPLVKAKLLRLAESTEYQHTQIVAIGVRRLCEFPGLWHTLDPHVPCAEPRPAKSNFLNSEGKDLRDRIKGLIAKHSKPNKVITAADVIERAIWSFDIV